MADDPLGLNGMLNPNRIGHCPECRDGVDREEDDYYKIERRRSDEEGTGDTIVYHEECAPFGATRIPEELDRQTRTIL